MNEKEDKSQWKKWINLWNCIFPEKTYTCYVYLFLKSINSNIVLKTLENSALENMEHLTSHLKVNARFGVFFSALFHFCSLWSGNHEEERETLGSTRSVCLPFEPPSGRGGAGSNSGFLFPLWFTSSYWKSGPRRGQPFRFYLNKQWFLRTTSTGSKGARVRATL